VSFRARILLASLPLALVPLLLFGLGARRDVSRRLETQYEERVAALADVVGEELGREGASVSDRLARLAQGMAADNDLRVALLTPEAESDPAARAYLLDYAPRAMTLAGLDVLLVLGADGSILSSGHFRNQYGSSAGALTQVLARAGDGPVLAELPTPTGSIRALTRSVPLRVGGGTFVVVGGSAVDEAFVERLGRGTDLDVALITGGTEAANADGRRGASATANADGGGATVGDGAVGGGEPESGDRDAGAANRDGAGRDLVREVTVPYVGADGESVARFVVRASDAPLRALLSDLDGWLVGAVVLAALLALVLGAMASAQLSGPVAELARRASRLDLDRLDVSFASERLDEIGDL
jgi:hypothetical protein